MVTPLASRTPSAPRDIAVATSWPFFTPAPHSTLTFGFTSFTAATVSDTIAGSAVVTEISPPINSGGSTAMKVGPKSANALASATSAAHAQIGKPSGNIAIKSLTWSIETLCSAWLIIVPDAPLAMAVCGSNHPV